MCALMFQVWIMFSGSLINVAQDYTVTNFVFDTYTNEPRNNILFRKRSIRFILVIVTTMIDHGVVFSSF